MTEPTILACDGVHKHFEEAGQRLEVLRGVSFDVHRGSDLPDQVRSVLRTSIRTGHARADQVAAIFSMHARTLNRHLNEFGISFRALVDEGRFEIAQQMLQSSAMEVAQIAAMLDYADASAFTRAFRRWSGTTPARWRSTRRNP